MVMRDQVLHVAYTAPSVASWIGKPVHSSCNLINVLTWLKENGGYQSPLLHSSTSEELPSEWHVNSIDNFKMHIIL